MKPKIIFLIRSNPMEDRRVAEGLRMAAGLGTGENSVKIILSGEALQLLDPDAEDLADMETLERYLPILGEWEIPFYAPKKELDRGIPIRSDVQVQAVDDETLAEVMAGGHCYFVFS